MIWNKKFIYPRPSRSIVNGVRRYSLEGSNLPSVTTIIKATKSEEDKAALAAWQARVGYAEAERIKNEASSRGSSMHSYIEQFLLGKFNLDLLEESDDDDEFENICIDKYILNKEYVAQIHFTRRS